MIDPATVGDWIQAVVMVGLTAAAGALLASALREGHERPQGGAPGRPLRESAPLHATPGVVGVGRGLERATTRS